MERLLSGRPPSVDGVGLPGIAYAHETSSAYSHLEFMNTAFIDNVYGTNDLLSASFSLSLTYNFYHGNSVHQASLAGAPTVLSGSDQDPLYVDTSAESAVDWDLHLQANSPLRNAGYLQDLDGSQADIGSYGGMDAWAE